MVHRLYEPSRRRSSGSATTIIHQRKKPLAARFRLRSGRTSCGPRIKACHRNRFPAGSGTSIALATCPWRKTMAGPCRRACSAHPLPANRGRSRHPRPRQGNCRRASTKRRKPHLPVMAATSRCRRRTSRTLGCRDKDAARNPGSQTFLSSCLAADNVSTGANGADNR